MRCRHFTLRLTTEHLDDDEARLNAFLQSIHVTSIHSSASIPGCWSILIFYEEAPTPEPVQAPPLTPEQEHIYEQLRQWRSQRAASEGKSAYVIAHNAVLLHIARHHMSIHAASDLAGIKQFGQARAARYGPDLLHLLDLLRGAADSRRFGDETL